MSQAYPVACLSKSPFVLTGYFAAGDGRMVPIVPTTCPGHLVNGGGPCSVRVVHYRGRKTGPQHPLAVARCRSHAVAFTLYPSGFAPYQRLPTVRMAPDGSALEPDSSSPHDPLDVSFNASLFEAALDASKGHAWARDSAASPTVIPDRWWSTQCRHLAMAACLLALSATTSEQSCATIAMLLSVELIVLRAPLGARGYRTLGGAIRRVLEQMRGGVRRALRLLYCGHVAALWGEPLHWNVERNAYERSPFLRPAVQDIE